MNSVKVGNLGRIKISKNGPEFKLAGGLAAVLTLVAALAVLFTSIAAPRLLQGDFLSNLPKVAGESGSQAANFPSGRLKIPAEILKNYQKVDFVRVIDGDTLVVNLNGEQVTLRLIGIDTPELAHGNQKLECFGTEAKQKLTGLVKNQQLLISGDQTQDNQDRYGRSLRYLALSDGTFVNYELVAQGYAFEYTYRIPYQYQTDFRAAQTQAREQKLGLYGAGCPVK